jgi:signal peptidase II
MKRPLIIIFLVLFLDQAVKTWVKTHMFLGQEYHIMGNWFIIHFTENNGMAYGMELAGNYGKLLLSLFRVGAAIGGSWYLYSIVKAKAHKGYITCVALILAGAIGNIIDSLFYGRLFSESTFQLAQFLPASGGYAGFLHGRVVDMLYFPLIEGHFPAWFPIWGTEEFLFFRPVFNIADSSITVGVIAVILFQKSFFKEEEKRGFVEETKLEVNNDPETII